MCREYATQIYGYIFKLLKIVLIKIRNPDNLLSLYDLIVKGFPLMNWPVYMMTCTFVAGHVQVHGVPVLAVADNLNKIIQNIEIFLMLREIGE